MMYLLATGKYGYSLLGNSVPLLATWDHLVEGYLHQIYTFQGFYAFLSTYDIPLGPMYVNINRFQ